MPVYSFKCVQCKHEFDEITIKAYWNDIRCRKCGGLVEKIMTSANFVIHGYSDANGYSKPKE